MQSPLTKGETGGCLESIKVIISDNQRLAAGDKNVFLLEGAGMIGEDVEANLLGNNLKTQFSQNVLMLYNLTD